MATATLSGTLLVTPTTSDGNFPVGATSVPYALTPSPKSVNACTGVEKRTVVSPAAFVALSGVGASDTVTQGTFLYLRTSAPMSVRKTFFNPAGGTTTAIVPVSGLLIEEFDPTKYLVLLEIEGTGIVEYLIGGPL